MSRVQARKVLPAEVDVAVVSQLDEVGPRGPPLQLPGPEQRGGEGGAHHDEEGHGGSLGGGDSGGNIQHGVGRGGGGGGEGGEGAGGGGGGGGGGGCNIANI